MELSLEELLRTDEWMDDRLRETCDMEDTSLKPYWQQWSTVPSGNGDWGGKGMGGLSNSRSVDVIRGTVSKRDGGREVWCCWSGNIWKQIKEQRQAGNDEDNNAQLNVILWSFFFFTYCPMWQIDLLEYNYKAQMKCCSSIICSVWCCIS